MYSLFISKNKNAYRDTISNFFGEPSTVFNDIERNLTDLYVQGFLNELGLEERNLIICPGYLSASNGTAFYFSEKYFNDGYHYNLGLLDGMGNKMRTTMNEQEISSHMVGNVDFLQFANPTTADSTIRDHRKMIFICRDNILNHTRVVNKANIGSFSNSIEILGILIGSSNFSKNTYYQNSQGEADILLFNDVNFANRLLAIIEDYGEEINSVLSESMSRVSPSYFNDILYNTLNDQLK